MKNINIITTNDPKVQLIPLREYAKAAKKFREKTISIELGNVFDVLPCDFLFLREKLLRLEDDFPDADAQAVEAGEITPVMMIYDGELVCDSVHTDIPDHEIIVPHIYGTVDKSCKEEELKVPYLEVGFRIWLTGWNVNKNIQAWRVMSDRAAEVRITNLGLRSAGKELIECKPGYTLGCLRETEFLKEKRNLLQKELWRGIQSGFPTRQRAALTEAANQFQLGKASRMMAHASNEAIAEIASAIFG